MTSPSIRALWKELQASATPTAVLVFAHGLERLSVQTQTPAQERQLQKLLHDLAAHLVGIYDQTVSFADLAEDVAATQAELMATPPEKLLSHDCAD
jgi:hypothetical protein